MLVLVQEAGLPITILGLPGGQMREERDHFSIGHKKQPWLLLGLADGTSCVRTGLTRARRTVPYSSCWGALTPSGWYQIHTSDRSDQIRSDQIRSDQIRSDQIRSDQIRSDHIRSHQITSDQIKSDQIRSDRSRSTVDHLHPNLPLWHVVQDPHKTHPRSGRAYGSHRANMS